MGEDEGALLHVQTNDVVHPPTKQAMAPADGAAPFIEIDGRRFYADRCYLNAMAGRDADPTGNDNAAGIQLFSRPRLVATLAAAEDEGLEACILTT